MGEINPPEKKPAKCTFSGRNLPSHCISLENTVKNGDNEMVVEKWMVKANYTNLHPFQNYTTHKKGYCE